SAAGGADILTAKRQRGRCKRGRRASPGPGEARRLRAVGGIVGYRQGAAAASRGGRRKGHIDRAVRSRRYRRAAVIGLRKVPAIGPRHGDARYSQRRVSGVRKGSSLVRASGLNRLIHKGKRGGRQARDRRPARRGTYLE